MTSTTRQETGTNRYPSERDRSHQRHRQADSVLIGSDNEHSPLLSVVMPALSEEESVKKRLDCMKNVVEDLQVPTEAIVSDSSTDRTPVFGRENGAIVNEPEVVAQTRQCATGGTSTVTSTLPRGFSLGHDALVCEGTRFGDRVLFKKDAVIDGAPGKDSDTNDPSTRELFCCRRGSYV